LRLVDLSAQRRRLELMQHLNQLIQLRRAEQAVRARRRQIRER
jgi:hypothetical protein